MAELKACIFDLDGVIVDTAKYHFLAWKRLADELQIPFTEEDNERLKGVSRMDSLDIILELGDHQASQEEKEEMATRKNEWYKEFIKTIDESEMLPGVLRFMQKLQEENIKIGLGSSSKNATTILEKIQLIPYFDAITDGNHISKAKPDPQIFLLGAESLQTEPENCVVFEDAVAGIEAAIAGGMHTVGIGSPDVLTEANIVAASLAEVDLDQVKNLFH